MTDLTTVATKLGREATIRVRAFTESNPAAAKAKDGVFTAVGLGVMGVQRANVALKALPNVITFKFDDGTTEPLSAAAVQRAATETVAAAKRQVAWIDERLTSAAKVVDDAVAPFEERLPDAVRDARQAARDAAQKAHELWRARFAETVVEQAAPVAKPTAKKATAKKAPAKKVVAKKTAPKKQD